jgi:hypothetical protein
MEMTEFFARLWGAFYLIFGSLFIVTRYLGKVIEMTEDRAFVISTGYISLLMGLVTVILHNVWVMEWRVAITILGWSTLIKGVLKIGFPEVINRRAQAFRKHQVVSAGSLIVLGGWLLWMSFVG